MDSVLDFDQNEIKFIKGVVKNNAALVKEAIVPLFEDSFHLLTSTQTKLDNFNMLKQIAQATEETQ
jgi:hypothetical protein